MGKKHFRLKEVLRAVLTFWLIILGIPIIDEFFLSGTGKFMLDKNLHCNFMAFVGICLWWVIQFQSRKNKWTFFVVLVIFPGIAGRGQHINTPEKFALNRVICSVFFGGLTWCAIGLYELIRRNKEKIDTVKLTFRTIFSREI